MRCWRSFALCAVFVAALAAGCDMHALMDNIVPPADVEQAKALVALFQKRDFDAIATRFDGADPGLRPNLERMAEMLPSDPPVAITETLASAHTDSNTGTSYELSLLYQFPKTEIRADMKFREVKDGLRFQSVTFSPDISRAVQKVLLSEQANSRVFLVLPVLLLVGGGLAVFLLLRRRRSRQGDRKPF
jgi:hypothetical protein